MPDENTETRQADESRTRTAIDHCLNAYKLCQRGLQRFRADAAIASALQDCADLSLVLANFLGRDSRHTEALAVLSAASATAAAEALAPFEHEDGELRTVYAACVRIGKMWDDLYADGASSNDEEKLEEAIRESFPASDPIPPPTQI